MYELQQLKSITDERGHLVALEAGRVVPFDIKRVYYLTDLKPGKPRGFHAHRELLQFAVCLTGHCTFVLDNGSDRQAILMDAPSKGLLIDKMVWHEMHNFAQGTVLLVLASELYDENDYIRDYNEFIRQRNGG